VGVKAERAAAVAGLAEKQRLEEERLRRPPENAPDDDGPGKMKVPGAGSGGR
jgi:hypothetical protein